MVHMQHDLVGCQSTPEIKKLRVHLGQPDFVIDGDMTSVSQVTDLMADKKVNATKKLMNSASRLVPAAGSGAQQS